MTIIAKHQTPRLVRGVSTSERGFVLIGVLWLGLLVSAVAGVLTLTAQISTDRAMRLTSRATDAAAAQAAIARVIAGLEASDPFLTAAAGTGEPLPVEAAGRMVEVTLTDLRGRPNINAADALPLTEAIMTLDMPARDAETLAARIVDFRDPDDFASVDGAEATDYESAGLSPPRNGPFQSMVELELVLGIDATLAARLTSVLRIGPPDPPPPPPPEVKVIDGRLVQTNQTAEKRFAGLSELFHVEVTGNAARLATVTLTDRHLRLPGPQTALD